ncbi:MAG: hypothetical protein U1F26_12510 [Lysobacterales bacterium]
MTREERVAMYMNFLQEEGFMPRVDDDGDVAFKFEGGNYCILVDEHDQEFFRLIFPGFWSIESEEERIKVNYAALQATADTKVAKVFPVRNNTWATIEMFCMPPENFRTVFMRSLRALRSAVDTFRKQMHAN